jgi:hypothetical protein
MMASTAILVLRSFEGASRRTQVRAPGILWMILRDAAARLLRTREV